MASPATEPTQELTTQRVPGARWKGFVVLVAALVVVGTLVWKPWDSGKPAASSVQTAPALAAASLPPATVPRTVSPPESTPPVPVPDPGGFPLVVDAPNDLGSIAFYTYNGPTVWCLYDSVAAAPPALATMIIEPPLVSPGADYVSARLRKVRWHAELDSNTQDKIFEADWIYVADSVAKTLAVRDQHTQALDAITIDVPQATPITVYRATIVVDWLGPRGRSLATQRVDATSYLPLGVGSSSRVPGGCSASWATY